MLGHFCLHPIITIMTQTPENHPERELPVKSTPEPVSSNKRNLDPPAGSRFLLFRLVRGSWIIRLSSSYGGAAAAFVLVDTPILL